MKISMRHRLFQHRIYLKLRQVMSYINFFVMTRKYVLQERASNQRKKAYSIARQFKSILWQLILAFVFAFLVYITDYAINDVSRYLIGRKVYMEPSPDYVTYLVTISGVGGVFIGLYYTAISSIASSIYARVPNNIRDLLVKDSQGNAYISALSFITFLSLVLAASDLTDLIDLPQPILAVPIMLILAGYGLFSFVKLGQRAFNLFDPVILGNVLFSQIDTQVSRVTANSLRWNNPSFQSHAHRLASSMLTTLDTISDIAANEQHLQGKPFTELSARLLNFLIVYESKKKRIPTNSKWYQEVFKHIDWYRSDHSSVQVAHETGTAIQPKRVADNEWLENRTLPIVEKCLRINLTGRRHDLVLNLISELDFYLTEMVKTESTARALSILENFSSVIIEGLLKYQDKEKIIEEVAIVDILTTIPTRISLSHREYINGIDIQKIKEKLEAIKWSNSASIYRHGFPYHYLEKLEWLNEKLSFESKTESKIVSPVWYQMELLSQPIAKTYSMGAQGLIKRGIELYDSWKSKLSNTGHPWLASAVLANEIEFWKKIDLQFCAWSQTWDNLNSVRKTEGLKWEKFYYDDIKEQIVQRKSHLIKSIAEQIPELYSCKRPENFPDYAGQFLHHSGETVFKAILDADEELLQSIFPLYFAGSLSQYTELQPDLEPSDWRLSNELLLASAPILDLLDLSGYAKLMSDFHRNELIWEIVSGVWTRYLENNEEKNTIHILAALITHSEQRMVLGNRDVFRTTWEMAVERKIKGIHSSAPLPDDSHDDLPSNKLIDNHESQLVRMYGKNARVIRVSNSGISIFSEGFLSKQEGAQGLDFGRNQEMLKSYLERSTD